MTALVSSIRHRARSIAEVVREHMTRRSYLLFLSFVWLALVYIIVAFTDVTATSFLGVQELENGEKITGGGVATSSLLYLVLPVIMGFLLRFTRLSVGAATLIFLPLVGAAIWVGQLIPFDIQQLFGLSKEGAQRAWNVGLLAYCLIASVLPMWMLLQPRGHLGGYFLYIALGAGMLGIIGGSVFAGKFGIPAGEGVILYPAFRGWVVTGADGVGQPLFPLLFITIACGACSGFHSIIASGTTSKQLKKETDARLIGYGAMLLEAMVAVVSLCCVMRLSIDSPLFSGGAPKPNFLYAQGIGSFMQIIGVPAAFGVSFGLMAFTTFVYDTLDVCTRLGRYILQELTGLHNAAGRWLATGLTAGMPLAFLLWQPKDASGKPAWLVFWGLFGASNQLLAALTLLAVTVWLWQTLRARWVLLVTGIPCVWMYCMSMWALFRIFRPLMVAAATGGLNRGLISNPVPWVAAILATLGLLMLVEAIRVILKNVTPPASPEAGSVPAAA